MFVREEKRKEESATICLNTVLCNFSSSTCTVQVLVLDHTGTINSNSLTTTVV